jgi:hypothetical protein
VRRIAVLTLGFVVSTTAGAASAGEWRTGVTGTGTAHWAEESGRLVYRGNATFGWAVRPGVSLADGFVQVRFRAVGGREDQAGGVVWRWLDPNHYYVARANALEDNVVAYKVVRGRRTDLTPVGAGRGAYGMKTRVTKDAWHTLRIDFTGPDTTVTFDGQRLFSVRDETFLTAGAVGVWSKADSVVEFEAFEFGPS